MYIVWKETNSIYDCEVVRVEDGKSRDNDVFLASDFSERDLPPLLIRYL